MGWVVKRRAQAGLESFPQGSGAYFLKESHIPRTHGLRPFLKRWALGPSKTPDSGPGLGPDPSLVYKVRF